ALEYARIFDIPVISHCEDLNLSGGGVMHEGLVSTELGLKGWPAAAEEVMVSRDMALAELTGSRLHIAHVSCAGSVQLIRQARERGIRVTAEVTPHHFTLTDEAVRGFDANTKVNPPLRTAEDIRALEEGLRDGTLEVIATDHAPHDLTEKDLEYAQASFGMVGLETALGLALERLYHRGILSLPQLLARLTVHPARVLGLDLGRLAVGAPADVTLFDPERRWQVDVNAFRSKSKNSPFHGWSLRGMALMTIVGGEIAMDRRENPERR
ncbi:MAG: dihydroorotase, partial [Candidatus Tectomicrobia bacterium]|nr:dihydroorotase [Candidatus Tectomicrobia bacterium]